MPGFDGTGPRGEGPMTGRGEGHCALVLPGPENQDVIYGYAGQQGTPVWVEAPYRYPAYRAYPPVYGLGRPRWGLGRGIFGWRLCLLGRGFWGRGRGWRW